MPKVLLVANALSLEMLHTFGASIHIETTLNKKLLYVAIENHTKGPVQLLISFELSRLYPKNLFKNKSTFAKVIFAKGTAV